VDSAECHRVARGWATEPVPADFHWLRDRASHAKYDAELQASQVISSVAVLGTIDLAADNAPFFSWSATLHVARDGWVHGLGGWFECELAAGVRMTNSPLADNPIRRPQAFLPLDEPVQVRTAEQISVTIMARPAENLLAWRAEFPATGRRFSHSTWHTLPLSPRSLELAEAKARPRASAAGRACSTVLAYCDGERSAGEIERIVLERHPELLPSRDEISRFVAHTIARYCDP
jgi:protein arginine N-methyltransferase 1